MDDSASQRTRLAGIERELARLQAEHDRAMSAFKFDTASALQHRIAALEAERRVVVASLPPAPAAAAPALGVVPVMIGPRRASRARRRR